ncbi:hypothetical protein [Allocatelliglobosispora scoriae]|nr:hypothetical protein [Allocatelliglobosispora scoriae]
MVNRYEVRTTSDQLVAFAEQKRMAFKEQVTLYADDAKKHVFAGFKARKVLDLGGAYDVTDAAGAPIGLFRKDFAASLLRSTWHVEDGAGTTTGQERSFPIALLRRFTDISFLPYHFDFVRNGQTIFSVEKKWGIRDKYVVTINDPHIDRRLVVSMAVALDALQGR